MKRTIVRILACMLALLMIVTAALAEVTDPNANEPGVYPVCKEPITLTVGVKQSSNVADYETNGYTLLCEKDGGVNLEIILFPETDDAEQKLKLMMNSGTKLPDILTFGVNDDNMRYQYGQAGSLIALDEYFDRENGLAQEYYKRCEEVGFDADEMLSLITSPDGHIYGVPTFQPGLSNRYSNRAYINQKWLDNLGLEAPTTIDELTEILIAFRDNDPNGNGIKDEIPMSGGNYTLTNNANVINWLQNLFIYNDCTAYRFLPVDENGVLDVSYDKEEYREFLKYINMLINEDLLDEACFTQSQNELRVALKAETETVGMMCGSASGFGNNITSWQPIEQPEGFYGNRTVTTIFSDFQVAQAITCDCEHPEIAFLFLMMGYSSDLYAKATRYGVLGVDWDYPTDDMISVYNEIGLPAGVAEINNVWGVPQNSNWQGSSVLPCANEGPAERFDGNEAYNERYHARSVMMNMKYAPDYSDIVKKLVYTPEEADEWASLRTSLQTYILESTSKFAMGILDPNSDEDWNNYLSELNTLRYKDMLELDNEVFARMKG